jgi:aerotaxis receptor
MKRSSDIQPINAPRKFDISELFFSTTDRKGIIAGCNDVFVRISAFTSTELLGAPHNTIRHPDMPRCIFKLLWDYILSGRPIGAYVKNIAKTGEYYWVFALVIPVGNQFLSIRLKPTSDLFPIVKSLYNEALQHEKSFGSDWRSGMEDSEKLVMNKLSSLGFESYDDFWSQAIFQEVASRRQSLGQEEKPSSTEERVFTHIGTLTELRKNLLEQSTYFKELADEINRVAINANVVAARLADRGRSLAVISQEVSRVANQILIETEKLSKTINPLREVLESLSTSASSSTLLSELTNYFKNSTQESELSTSDQKVCFGETFEELERTISLCHNNSLEECGLNLVKLKNNIATFKNFKKELSKILLNLQLGYVTGKSIAIATEGGQQFSLLLEAIVNFSDDAMSHLTSLDESIQSVSHLAE